MKFDLAFWLGIYGGVMTLAAVPFAWWLTNRSAARARAAADRAALRERADRLLVAVVDLRGAAMTNHLLWESRRQRWSTYLLAVMAAAGGAARVEGSDLRRALAAAGGVARLLGGERREGRTGAVRLSGLMSRVVAETGPFLRHQQADVVAAVEELLAAVRNIEDEARLDAAMRAFGRAVGPITTDPEPRWARRRRVARTAQ